MKISVIIPSFNSGAYLAGTLRSLEQQSNRNFEVIIMDGGSTDSTAQVVRSFGDLVTRFVVSPDKGQLDAVQNGLALATGDIHFWLNADDVVMPGAFEYVAEAFQSDPDIDIVYSDNYAFDERRAALYVGPTVRGLRYQDHLLFYRQMYSECVYWRARATKFVGEEFLSLRVYTDYAFILNMRSGRREKWVPKRLGAFRIAPNQASEVHRSKAASEYQFIRSRAYQRHGWTRLGVAMRRGVSGPSFCLRHVFYPRIDALVRRARRIAEGDRTRSAQAKLFFETWLRGSVEGNDKVLERKLFR